MNYLKQINSFYKWLTVNHLSSNAQCLYNLLLHINNSCNWKNEFSVANLTLMGFTNLNKQALYRARNELIQMNLIKFKKGINQNQAGKYQIIEFVTANVTTNDTADNTPNDTANPSNLLNVTADVTADDTADNTPNDTANPSNLLNVTADVTADNTADNTPDNTADNTADDTINKLNINKTKTKLNTTTINNNINNIYKEPENKKEPSVIVVGQSCTRENNIKDLSNAYQENIGIISPGQFNDLIDYLDKMDKDTIIYAIRQASDSAHRNFRYVDGILKNYVNDGVKTLAEAKQKEAEFKENKLKQKDKLHNGRRYNPTETVEEETARLKKEWGIE